MSLKKNGPPSVSRQRALRLGSVQGGDDGRSYGWEHGYHLGRCEAIRSSVSLQQPAASLRPMKLLYIPQGFPAIDQGVIAALKRSVAEVIVGTPAEMLKLAEAFRPDVVLVLNGLHLFPADHTEQIVRIRQLGIRTVIWFADDPYFTDDTAVIAPCYDTVATHELSCVTFYRSLGCEQVLYMPLAVDTDVFRPRPSPMNYRSDVCFIGMGFWNRIEVFDAIAKRLVGKKVFIGGGLWERMRHYRLLKPNIRDGWIPVEESVQYYSGAKIVINLHRGADDRTGNRNGRGVQAQSINPRTFEIAACGTLQLTDLRDDLVRYYTPGVELDVYRTPEELADKIDWYLQHEDLRRTIAYNGLRRTLSEHSFEMRVEQLLQALGCG